MAPVWQYDLDSEWDNVSLNHQGSRCFGKITELQEEFVQPLI